MRALLALSILLLAGCSTTGGHEGHVTDGWSVTLGVLNKGTAPAAFELRVDGPPGSGPMSLTVGVQPNQTVERMFNITNEGSYNVVAKWGRGVAYEVWSTEDCRSFHVVFHVDPAQTGEVTPDRMRECH